MADKRKLQMEIDRTLKKVEEGVQLFDEIWEKVHAARETNHREKHEADLKKEIKKLQRHRDQIKGWLTSSDIKDKKSLLDFRKLIENKMEQFKVCEKEAKTKTFSKEGLAREQKVDPKEQAKTSTRGWLQDSCQMLGDQLEGFEADLEKLCAGKGKAKNKEDIVAMEGFITRHKKHIAKLEQIIRLMDNDLLDPAQIDDIRELIEFFVESNQDPSMAGQFDDDDDMYETLELDDAPIQLVDLGHREVLPKRSPRDGVEEEEEEQVDEEALAIEAEKRAASAARKERGGAAKAVIPTTIGRPQAPSKLTTTQGSPVSKPTAAPPVIKAPPTAAAVLAGGRLAQPPGTPGGKTYQGAAIGRPADEPRNGESPAKVPPSPTAGSAPASTVAAQQQQLAQQQAAQAQQQQRAAQLQQQQQAAALERQRQQQQPNAPQPLTPTGASQPPPILQPQPPLTAPPPLQTQSASPGLMGLSQAPLSPMAQMQGLPPQLQQGQQSLLQSMGPGLNPPILSQQPVGGVLSPPFQAQPSPSVGQEPLSPMHQAQASMQAQRARVGQPGMAPTILQPPVQPQPPQSYGQTQPVGPHNFPDKNMAAPFAAPEADADGLATAAGMDPAQAAGVKTGPETLQMQMNFLNMAMLYIPTQHDAERPKQYFPRNPYPVNSAYPTTPAPIFETPAIFEKLGTDTLFFIFYYQQGTYQQYLAAKELKKQSWRYHKKYMTWFQRHEEPKITTDEFEQGTYVYFDCESGWCQRIKQEFVFEYTYLEAEEDGRGVR